ncbi:hypothetical protein CEXT_323811 [Caerostris extrusa]|uniref:Uncharacterized protein n=1 Tax=Caerostris extrusa TaxID=172846 RepID=A0AAV4X931_CAEEX|nr:hypothetical protein CEXT_323811 [Caerostris extrusa]
MRSGKRKNNLSSVFFSSENNGKAQRHGWGSVLSRCSITCSRRIKEEGKLNRKESCEEESRRASSSGNEITGDLRCNIQQLSRYTIASVVHDHHSSRKNHLVLKGISRTCNLHMEIIRRTSHIISTRLRNSEI